MIILSNLIKFIYNWKRHKMALRVLSSHASLPQRSSISSGVYPKLFLSLLLVGGCAYGGAVNCTNGSGDVAAIQTAVNAGGTVTISGTCSITKAINVTKPAVINGPATLTALPSILAAFWVTSDNVTINNLTFVQGGVYAPGGNARKRSNITITNNTFRDFVAFNWKAGIETDCIAYNWNISRNTFQNFWQNGFTSTTTNPQNSYSAVAGIVIWGGLDHTVIFNNSFDEMENDSMHFFSQGTGANSGGYTASGVVIAYNFFTRQHRMGIEYQDFSSTTACPGGCNNSAATTTGTVIKNNYFHLPAWPYYGTFPYSIVNQAYNAFFINNTAIVEAAVDPGNPIHVMGYGWENYATNTGILLQGNLISSISVAQGQTTPHIWAQAIANYPPGSTTNVYQNNLFCGYIQSPAISQHGPHTEKANYIKISALTPGTCPGGVGTANSGIQLAFTTPNNQTLLRGDVGTWDVSVVSNLSISHVQFFVDSSSTPIVKQEIQDVNTNFANDRTWLYHADINTSGIAPGAHTLTAKTTDVSGASQTITQSFTVN
jgi:hypothetical protein